MGMELPKQYLPLAGRTVIEHTIERIARTPYLSAIVVALAADDQYWKKLKFNYPIPIDCVTGGAERVNSVFAGLNYLSKYASPHDWILVHDAARPCLRLADLEKLVTQLATHSVGGLLAIPITDTVKRADSQSKVIETLSRSNLWRALTPQMFRLDKLNAALTRALTNGQIPTDEAEVMENNGYQPLIIPGHADNLKITHAQDLILAELFLHAQKQEQRNGTG